jgi:hypothetical protein
MTRRWPCIVLLGFVVSACGAGDTGDWGKPSNTRWAFERDAWECRSRSWRDEATHSDKEDLYNDCMEARGYRRGFISPPR